VEGGSEHGQVGRGDVTDRPDARQAEEPDDRAASRPNRLVTWGRQTFDTGRSSVDRRFQQHRHRPLVDLGVRIYERDRDVAGAVVGSAIAFRLFLFFVPLLLFAVGLAGFLGAYVERRDLDGAGLSGGLAAQIGEALTQPNSTRWIAVGLGAIGMVTTGRTLSKTMIAASCLAWQIPLRARASVKVTGAVVGLLAGVALVAALVNRIRTGLGLAVTGVSLAVALGVYVVAWVLVLALVPRRSKDPASLLPGGLLLAAVLAGMQAVSQLYLPGRFSRASELYGAIGTTIVTLGWFFILGRAIVVAMVVNAAVYERFGSISGIVFSLPGVRALPRRSALVRRVFGLEVTEQDVPPPEP
jgi:uncharacterized BrkB/YihY/UPF0761 family membrane protein